MPSPGWPCPVYLIQGHSIPRSYALLFLTASDLTSITSHIHSWALFSWLHLLIISGVISPLFSSSILGTYQPGEFIFQCHIFLPFILFMGFSRHEYWVVCILFSTGPHFIITMNKASEGDGIPVELFQILKDDAVKVLHSVHFSCSVVSDSLQPHGLQHARLPCLSPLPELTQNHVYWVGDATQQSHPLSSPSPPP